MTSPINPNQEPTPRSSLSSSPSANYNVERGRIPLSSQAPPPIPHNSLRTIQSREAFVQSLEAWKNTLDISSEEDQVLVKQTEVDLLECFDQKKPSLNLSDRRLPSIPDLSAFTWLKELDLSCNQLTSFDGQGLTSLTYLNLYKNKLTSFDGQGLASLTVLKISHNQLTSFNGKGLALLTEINLSYNQLISFNGQGLTVLTKLDLFNNKLTSFDSQGLTSLTHLNLSKNSLSSFDGKGLALLTHLILFGNQLTSFNGRGLTSIISLNLSYNQLISFNGQCLSSLTRLDLSYNQIDSFNGQGLTSLTNLRLHNNKLILFDGQGLTSLTELFLEDNELTSFAEITLPAPGALRCLRLRNNLFEPLSVGAETITVRIPSGVIQDIPEGSLYRYGVEIISHPESTNTTSLSGVLKRLCGDSTKNSKLLEHKGAPALARFLERMMLSWPRYDSFLKSFIHLAENNPRFRSELFDGVISTETNCHDRPLYFFSRLSVSAAAYTAEEENNPKALVQSLIALKYLDLIDAQAQMVCPGEALEVALYLQLQLRTRLHLPIAIESMAFDQYAQRAISGYLVNHREEPQTVMKWVELVASICENTSATVTQQIELLCDTPYFFKRCEGDPKVKLMRTRYAAAINFLFDSEVTEVGELVDKKELESLGDTSLDDLLLLIKSAMPEELRNTSLQDLTDGQKVEISRKLGLMKEEALQKLTFELMEPQAKALVEETQRL